MIYTSVVSNNTEVSVYENIYVKIWVCTDIARC